MAVQRGKSIGRLPLSVASGTNELFGFVNNESKFIDIDLNELLQGAVDRGEAGVAPAVLGNALKTFPNFGLHVEIGGKLKIFLGFHY